MYACAHACVCVCLKCMNFILTVLCASPLICFWLEHQSTNAIDRFCVLSNWCVMANFCTWSSWWTVAKEWCINWKNLIKPLRKDSANRSICSSFSILILWQRKKSSISLYNISLWLFNKQEFIEVEFSLIDYVIISLYFSNWIVSRKIMHLSLKST